MIINKKSNKFFLLYLIISTSFNNFIMARNGGAIAAGILGGFGAGAIIGAIASSNRNRTEIVYPREVIYIDKRQRNDELLDTNLSWQNDTISNKEYELLRRERNLQIREKKLKQKYARLIEKEKQLNA